MRIFAHGHDEEVRGWTNDEGPFRPQFPSAGVPAAVLSSSSVIVKMSE